MAMELRQLRYAVALSETLHFGRAAQRHFVTQSALSQQIARLERELGAVLFERSSHHVSMTPAGELFAERARELLADVDALHAEVLDAAAGLRGTLRIGLFGDVTAELTPLILNGVTAALPETRLTVRELSMTDQVEALLEGDVDVAILNPPVDTPQIAVDVLFEEPRVAMVPSGHPLAAATTAMVADLLDEPFALAAPGAPDAWRAFWSVDDDRGAPSRAGAEVTSVWEALIAVAHLGADDTFPASAVRRYEYAGVTPVPLRDASFARVGIATRAGDTDPAAHVVRAVARRVADEHLDRVPLAVAPGSSTAA
jgi:DNA-binding transcriptional LysR family regulator